MHKSAMLDLEIGDLVRLQTSDVVAIIYTN